MKLPSQLWQPISYLSTNKLATKQPLEWQTLKQTKPYPEACCNLLEKPSGSHWGSQIDPFNFIPLHILRIFCEVRILPSSYKSCWSYYYYCYYGYKYYYFCTWRFNSMALSGPYITRNPSLLRNGLFRIGRW